MKIKFQISIKFQNSSTKFCQSVVKVFNVIVLSKFCRRPPTKTSINVTSRLPRIGHLIVCLLMYCLCFQVTLEGEYLLTLEVAMHTRLHPPTRNQGQKCIVGATESLFEICLNLKRIEMLQIVPNRIKLTPFEPNPKHPLGSAKWPPRGINSSEYSLGAASRTPRGV